MVNYRDKKMEFKTKNIICAEKFNQLLPPASDSIFNKNILLSSQYYIASFSDYFIIK
jgi:hypothetical protein